MAPAKPAPRPSCACARAGQDRHLFIHFELGGFTLGCLLGCVACVTPKAEGEADIFGHDCANPLQG
jgi:hypothetical protein